MTEELSPCPFCGGEVSVVVLDEEGNVRDEEYERDPYSGLSYAVAHDDPNGECPIATYDAPLPWLYDSRDSVAHVWNSRAERTCRMADCGSHDTCVVNRELCNGDVVSMEFGYRQCSECGAYVFDCPTVRYCPSCGAKVVDGRSSNRMQETSRERES